MSRVLPPGIGSTEFSENAGTHWGHHGETPSSPITLREIIGVLRRRAWLIFGIFLLAVPFAVYTWYSAERTFGAIASIRFIDAMGAITGNLVNDPVTSIQSEIVVITSRSTALAVIDSAPELRVRARDLAPARLSDVQITSESPPDSLRLVFAADSFVVVDPRRADPIRSIYGTPIEVEGLTFTIDSPPRNEAARLFVEDGDIAARRLRGNLRAEGRRDTDIIDIRYVDRDPARAVQVVNQFAATYQSITAKRARQNARTTVEFLDGQLKTSDSLLQEARDELSAFRSRRGVNSDNAVPQDLSDVRRQRNDALADARAFRAYLAQLQAAQPPERRELFSVIVPSANLTAHPEVSGLYVQMLEYERQVEELRTTTSPTNPDVLRLEELISTVQGNLATVVASALRIAILEREQMISRLDDQILTSEERLRRLPNIEAEEARLMEQVEAMQANSNRLLIELQQARLAEAVEVGPVEMFEPATGASPISGGTPQRIGVILLLGLIAGVGSAFFAEVMNTSIRGHKELAALGVPVLGMVPRLKDKPNGAGSVVDAKAIEALRGIRLNMVHAHGAADTLVATVSSPGSGDGKSFITTNLALAFASAGHETLVIDGDTRRGVLHGLLRTKRKPGLTDYLLGSEQQIIQGTQFPHLYVIGCGSRTPGAPEHLGSSRMKELMLLLRRRFGVVLIDSPPIGAGVDALTLGTVSGNLVLVVRSGNTNRDVAQAKLDILERLPIRLLGVVANAVRDGDSDGYSGYYIEGYDFEDELVEDKPQLFKRAVTQQKPDGWATKKKARKTKA